MNSQQLLQAGWLDILFDQRNKLYGAYLLRRTYQKRLKFSLLAMLLIVMAISCWAFQKKDRADILPPIVKDVVPISPLPLPQQKMILPPPPPPVLSKAVAAIKNVTFKIVADKLVHPEEMPPDIDKLLHANIALQNNFGLDKADMSNIPRGNNSTGVIDKENESEPPYFISVEQMPEFPGGEKAMFEFLAKHLQFTALAKEAGIQGTVYLSFIINEDGDIQNVKIIKGLGYGLDESAVKAVQAMPRWKPGRQNGKTAPVLFELPVKFVLQ